MGSDSPPKVGDLNGTSRALVRQIVREIPQIANGCLCLSVAVFCCTLRAQEAPRQGFQISSVSGFGVYYSTALPEGSIQFSAIKPPSDIGFGGSVQVDWSHFTESSRVMFTYTPSYTGRLRLAAWNALNHAGSFNAARRFGRWELSFSAGGNLSNLSEFLFSPTVFANAVAAPATFTDLSAAVLTGTFTNAQLASLLTGAPLVTSPARNLYFGERMFTAGAQTSLAYALSPRVSIKFGASAGRTQHLSDNLAGSAQGTFLIPRTSSAGAGFELSYALAPRTQLGVSASSGRVESAIEDAYTTIATSSLGRTMGRHWFLQLSGGVGKMITVRTLFPVDTAPHPVMNATLGFRTLTHTFLGSYGRTVSDSYGLGATTTSSASIAWRWKRPGRSWSMQSSLSWQQLAGLSAFANSSGWRVEGGFSRALGNHLALLTECVYLHYSQQLATVPPLSQTAVRVSLIWRPQPHAFQ